MWVGVSEKRQLTVYICKVFNILNLNSLFSVRNYFEIYTENEFCQKSDFHSENIFFPVVGYNLVMKFNQLLDLSI